jgi:hypothetical protein
MSPWPRGLKKVSAGRQPLSPATRPQTSGRGPQAADKKVTHNRRNAVSNAEEKRIGHIAESKGFHLEKAGHGKGHGRFYIVNVAEASRMRSGVADHEYSFSLEEAEAWLSAHTK